MKARKLRRRQSGGLLFAAVLVIFGTQSRAAVDKALLKSQEATAALMRGQFDQAVLAFDDALTETTLPPARKAGLYSDRGVAKWRLKQLNDAMADFTKAISFNPDYAPAYNNRGNVLMDLNRSEDAYKDFDKAVALSPGFGAAYANRGNANQSLKRLDAAEDDFRKAIELMPTNAIPYNGRGKMAGALGRYYTALRYLNKAVGLNGQYAPAYLNRALFLLQLERYGDAIQDFDKLIALAPENADLYVYRGQAYAGDKRGPQAFRDFSKALELAPDHVKALIGRASQNIDRKRVDLALNDLNHAVELDPQNAEAYFWRGQARQTLGDADGGEQDLSKAIGLNPSYAEAYSVRAAFRDRAEKKDDAISDYRRALELDPFSREARDAYIALSGDTADSAIKSIAPAVDGWEVYRSTLGRFIAVNEHYPKLPVLLEMEGGGVPEILEWTPLKDWLAGIGLLRYRAGQKKDAVFEDVALIDLNRSQVISIEPYVRGDLKSKWSWTQNAVTVTDQDGLSSYYELKKPKPVEQAPRVANDDPFGWLSGRANSRDRSNTRRGSGVFGWLFN